MKEWKDAIGRQWRINLLLTDARRIENQTGLCLLDFPKANQMLEADPYLLFDLCWATIAPQAEPLGVQREAFLDAGLPGAIETFQRAFYLEWADFLGSLGRGPMARAIKKTLEKVDTLDAAMEKKIDDELERVFREILGT